MLLPGSREHIRSWLVQDQRHHPKLGAARASCTPWICCNHLWSTGSFHESSCPHDLRTRRRSILLDHIGEWLYVRVPTSTKPRYHSHLQRVDVGSIHSEQLCHVSASELHVQRSMASTRIMAGWPVRPEQPRRLEQSCVERTQTSETCHDISFCEVKEEIGRKALQRQQFLEVRPSRDYSVRRSRSHSLSLVRRSLPRTSWTQQEEERLWMRPIQAWLA